MDMTEKRDQMIREWGLQDLSPEEQDSTIEKIGEVLYQSIIIRASALMDEAAHAKLDAFTAEKGDILNATEVLEWMRINVNGFETIAAEESAKLRERIVAAPR
jgi:hypothetical protein